MMIEVHWNPVRHLGPIPINWYGHGWAAAFIAGAALFVHPWDMLGKERMSKYWLPWLLGMPTETALAICSLVFSGVFKRLPRLRIAFARPERIALGSDYPFPLGEPHPGRCIESVGLDAPTMARLLHGTALEWPGLPNTAFA